MESLEKVNATIERLSVAFTSSSPDRKGHTATNRYAILFLLQMAPPGKEKKEMDSKRHLTIDERVCISVGLTENKSATEIGKDIGFNKSTVSREVKQYRMEQKTGAYGRPFNDCVHRSRCPKSHECMIATTNESLPAPTAR